MLPSIGQVVRSSLSGRFARRPRPQRYFDLNLLRLTANGGGVENRQRKRRGGELSTLAASRVPTLFHVDGGGRRRFGDETGRDDEVARGESFREIREDRQEQLASIGEA